MTECYCAYGLRFASNFGLPLPPCSEEGQVQAELRVSEHRIPEPLSWEWEFAELPEPGGACRWRIETACGQTVVFAEVCGGELKLSHCQFVEPSCVKDILLHPLLAHLVRRSGRLGLHASVVEWRGQGVALVGSSGEGKSTLATRLCELGAGFMADDVALLSRWDSGWVVYSGPTGPRMASDADSADRVFPLRHIPWPEAAVRKWEHQPELSSYSSVPLSAVVVLKTSAPGTAWELKPLNGKHKLLQLLQNRFGSRSLPSALLVEEFAQLSQLVADMPVILLQRPRDTGLLEAQANAVLDSLRSN